MVHPHILPPSIAGNASSSTGPAAPHPPRVEYLATLMRHSAPVNVVRFSPSGEFHLHMLLQIVSNCLLYIIGELIASAGDGKAF